MRHLLAFSLLLLCTLYYNSAFSSNLKILAAFKPIHSLVASVTDGILNPELLMYEVISEHNYMFRPSDINKLESCNIIFYIDDSLEKFVKAFAKENKKLVQLSSTINLLPARPHSFSSLIQNEKDLHIWLSPENAKSMILSISTTLSNMDIENSYLYNINAMKTIRKIDQEAEKIKIELNEFKNQKYIVTHDAYQYFEKYFGLSYPSAILSIEEDSYISMKNLMKLKKMIKEKNIKCIFSHSRKDSMKLNTISNYVKMVVLDPVGSDIKPGKDAYLDIINRIAQNFKSCFVEQ